MNRKNFAATGSFLAEDRPRVLDCSASQSQLMFNTFHNRRLYDWEHSDDLDLAYGAARAHNRGMVEFCSVDPRLLPTCYVPLVDFDRAGGDGRRGDRDGRRRAAGRVGLPARALAAAHRRSTRCGRRPQEAGIPVVFHVGGTGDLIDPNYFDNGLPIPPDFHGGEENFRSVDYMGDPVPPMQTLATMIFDGVLERFPTCASASSSRARSGCRAGCGRWSRRSTRSPATRSGCRRCRCARASTSSARSASRRTRPRTSAGSSSSRAPKVLLFNTDYPHVEGGRRPFERFERSLGDASEEVRQSASTPTTSST